MIQGLPYKINSPEVKHSAIEAKHSGFAHDFNNEELSRSTASRILAFAEFDINSLAIRSP